MSRRQQHDRSRALRIAFATTGVLVVAGCADQAPDSPPGMSEPRVSVALPAAADDKLLPLEDRKRVWDIEHLAFLVEREVFPIIKQAWRRQQWEPFAAFLIDEFVGAGPAGDWKVAFSDAALHSVERTSEDGAVSWDSDGFINELQAYRELFDPLPEHAGVSVGLVRLSPHGQSLDESWWGRWKLQCTGELAGQRRELQLMIYVELERVTEGMANRRHWIRSARIESARMTTSQTQLLVEQTERAGWDLTAIHDNWTCGSIRQFEGVTGGVFLTDFDQDGELDVLLEDVRGGTRLYRGNGNATFTDVTSSAGLHRLPGKRALWTQSCWIDVDGDGDDDLITGEWVYENRGDGTFSDVTDRTNFPLVPAEGYAVADYDGDGRLDIYVCHSAPYLAGQKAADKVKWIDGALGVDNVLLRNLGDWQFEDVTARTGTGGSGSACFAAVWMHANSDRKPDLLAINEFGRNSLFLSQNDERYIERSIDPVFGGFSMGVIAGDYNNDGLTDLYVANMYSKAGNRILANVNPESYDRRLYEQVQDATTGSKLYTATGDGDFQVEPMDYPLAAVGWAYGAAFVDLNGDGFQDVYATAGFQSVKRGEPDG